MIARARRVREAVSVLNRLDPRPTIFAPASNIMDNSSGVKSPAIYHDNFSMIIRMPWSNTPLPFHNHSPPWPSGPTISRHLLCPWPFSSFLLLSFFLSVRCSCNTRAAGGAPDAATSASSLDWISSSKSVFEGIMAKKGKGDIKSLCLEANSNSYKILVK